MSSDMEVPRLGPDQLRSELRIPLAPARGGAAALRAALTWLVVPAFAEARGVTVRAAAIAVSAVVVGRFAFVEGLRPWLLAAAVMALAVLAARAVVLSVAEGRQRRFQDAWLRSQTNALRAAWFEVVRLTVLPVPSAASTVWDAVGYDLTRPQDVRRLRLRQAAEQAAGRTSRVVVEFCPGPGPRGQTTVETVHVDLVTLDLRSTATRLLHGGISFPQASYHARPAVDRGGRSWPARETFWTLGKPVVSSVEPGE